MIRSLALRPTRAISFGHRWYHDAWQRVRSQSIAFLILTTLSGAIGSLSHCSARAEEPIGSAGAEEPFGSARAEEPLGKGTAVVEDVAILNPHPKKMGVKECAACHTQPGFLYPKTGVTQFVRLTEAVQWNDRDKHAYAYELVRIDLSDSEFDQPKRISNRRARDMLTKLGWQTGDNRFERQCLSCHAGLDPSADLSTVSLRENIAYGVQCEACHGPGENYMRSSEHQQPAWRTKSPDEKALLGMTDLSNAAVCSEVCLSCHLGNLASGRFVTHEMYAAGHPPLPPFDLQTFLDAMPPHWGTIQEKPYPNAFVKDASRFQYEREYLQNHFALDPSQSTAEMRDRIQQSNERSKRSMISAMMTENASLQLLHDASRQQNVWGDYALFDCMGCHQSLDQGRSRFRPAGRIPGRPFPPTWSTVSDSLTGNRPSSAPIQAKINEVFNAIPFGDRERWELGKPSFERFLVDRRNLAMSWSKKVVDASETKEWVEQLIQDQSPKLNDYWVAKQTAWMVQIAVQELIARKQLPPSLVDDHLQPLDRILGLNLAIPQQQSVLAGQPATLHTAQSFDIAAVRDHLESIRRSLR